MKQSGKVQDFVDAFESALTQINLPPEHALSIFLDGLEHNTQMHLTMFNPNSIAHAANLAKLHESCKPPVGGGRFSPRPNTNTYKPVNVSSPPMMGTNSGPHSSIVKSHLAKAPRTFDAAEMA